MHRILLLTILIAAASSGAQARTPPPPGAPHPPPPGAGVPSPEQLATAPGLSAEQQIEVRRILIERRNAHEAQRAKDEAAGEAARAESRAAHERIDDASAVRLRKTLGDDGYRQLAAWLEHARPQGPHRAGPRGPGANDRGIPPDGPDVDGDGAEAPAPVSPVR